MTEPVPTAEADGIATALTGPSAAPGLTKRIPPAALATFLEHATTSHDEIADALLDAIREIHTLCSTGRSRESRTVPVADIDIILGRHLGAHLSSGLDREPTPTLEPVTTARPPVPGDDSPTNVGAHHNAHGLRPLTDDPMTTKTTDATATEASADRFRTKFPAKGYDADGRHVGPGPWLDLMRKANAVHNGFFGAPLSTQPWWAGGDVEVYAHARVIHHPDESVSIVALDELGDQVLAQADAVLRGAANPPPAAGDTEAGPKPDPS